MAPNDIEGIVITHPERVVFPDDGITKQAVAAYYHEAMRRFLPGIAHRPTSVLRFPEGIGGQGFFQKHPMPGLRHTEAVHLREEGGGWADYLCPADAGSVIELVQFGTLEFHPWAARADAPDEADYLVFDLDPGPGVAWRDVIEAARLVRGRLAGVGLKSFVRTTGGKGLHVVTPLHHACAWDDAKRFTQGFARALARDEPRGFTSRAAMEEREGRIFIDYLRNSRGATSVASYSLRARRGAPVAMPLRWQELGRCRGGQDFHWLAARRRLAQLHGDPWDGFASLRQDLGKALRTYGATA
ncbi:non-homologous end-joining DNA ligase [Dyella sedimenti]|uniref:non-homologous end-joining DNA ligase n=1 Tax=Dyella sedimenti TaxID=2919947 RepID=UPI001FA97D19|nr:non-homologous end-joining DNA ligase [Dyella sedimenti]